MALVQGKARSHNIARASTETPSVDRISLSARSVVSSEPAYTAKQSSAAQGTEEPWLAILLEELERSFREFAKESGRLNRLVQKGENCCIPSEGFNRLAARRMAAVERTFQIYMRRKEEFLSYIKATAWRARSK
jgi:hypothetical protein